MKRFLLLFLLLLVPLLAHATVTNTSFSVSYTCTGSTGPFAFTFPISDPTAMTVTQNNVTLPSTSYTIQPVNNNYSNGGSVTLTTPCPSAQTLTLTRTTPLTQTTQYYDNMPVPMSSFMYGLDKLTEITQELDYDVTHLYTYDLLDWSDAGAVNGDCPIWNSATKQWTAQPCPGGTNTYPGVTSSGTGGLQASSWTLGTTGLATFAEVNGARIGVDNNAVSWNTFLGYNALPAITPNISANCTPPSGCYNTAVGQNSMEHSTTADDSVAVGEGSLYWNTTGGYNVAVGEGSEEENTTGTANVALGQSSLFWNTTGGYNTALGNQALYGNGSASTDHDNVAVGNYALRVSNGASENAAVGSSSLTAITTGSYNAAIGYGSCDGTTTGAENLCSGYIAGAGNTTGSLNTWLGSQSGPGSNVNLTNSTCVGYNCTNTASNQVMLGNTSVTTTILFGAVNGANSYNAVNSSASNVFTGTFGSSAYPTFDVTGGGTMNFGSGTAATDTDFYRASAGSLKTDGIYTVGGNMFVIGNLYDAAIAPSSSTVPLCIAPAGGSGLITTAGCSAGGVYTGTSPIVVSGTAISCPTCSVGSGTSVSFNGGSGLGTLNFVQQGGSISPDSGYVGATWKNSSSNWLPEVPTAVTSLGFTPAHSGSNSDITSLSGLTTALSVGQGGTGLATCTGYPLGSGTSAMTCSSTIPNAGLAHASMTVSGSTCTLGSSCTISHPWQCGVNLGGSTTAYPAGTYKAMCQNTTGVTITITGVKCSVDAGTATTANAAGVTLGALLTSAFTCGTGIGTWTSGTQSSNVLLTSGDTVVFTIAMDGTAALAAVEVTGTYTQ